MGRSKRPDAIPEPQKEKRGRGRPRKANAMSGAQRQASYRARQAANGISVTVTKKDVIDAASHAAVLHERDRLLQEVAQLRGATSLRTTRASKTGSEIIDQALGSAVPENDLGLDEKRLSVTLNGAQGFALTRLHRSLSVDPAHSAGTAPQLGRRSHYCLPCRRRHPV